MCELPLWKIFLCGGDIFLGDRQNNFYVSASSLSQSDFRFSFPWRIPFYANANSSEVKQKLWLNITNVVDNAGSEFFRGLFIIILFVFVSDEIERERDSFTILCVYKLWLIFHSISILNAVCFERYASHYVCYCFDSRWRMLTVFLKKHE